jgi:hypothetical protein
MDAILRITRVLTASLKLFVLLSLIVMWSGLGHAGAHALSHVETDVAFEHDSNPKPETDGHSLRASSSDCEVDVSLTGGQQNSDHCCAGICMSLALHSSNDTALREEIFEVYAQIAASETFGNAVVLERPPRHLI